MQNSVYIDYIIQYSIVGIVEAWTFLPRNDQPHFSFMTA